MKKYLDLADKSEYYYLKDNAIVTKLPEIGYMEELHDEDWYEKSYIWFYGEWLGSEEANVESNLKTMAMRIRDLLKESNHAQWKEVDDFLKQYEHMHVCDEKLIRRMVCNCHIRAWGDLHIAGIEYGDWINLLEDFSEALKKHVHLDFIAEHLGQEAIKDKAHQIYVGLSDEVKEQIVQYQNGARNKTWMLNRCNLKYIVDNDIYLQ